jgi:hypothetical protein
MDLRICDAIEKRRLLMFAYGGLVRTVEPHLYGQSTAGHEALSAWMRAGWSRTDPEGGWRMFRLDGVTDLQVLPEEFPDSRPDFNPGDPHFTEIFCSIVRPASDAEKSSAAI